MRPFFFLLLTIVNLSTFAQSICGFDELYRKSLNNPLEKEKIMAMDKAISTKISSLKTMRTLNRSAYGAAQIPIDDNINTIATPSGFAYLIPVVVHIVHTGTAVGSADNPTDNQIINMINRVNAIFGASQSGYAPLGNGGVDIPIRFVLAKRDPNCNASNGIKRVDGSVLPEYAQYGVKYGSATNGAWDFDMKALSQWPGGSYYNIWIVNKITSNSGVVAYASYPGGTLNNGTVINVNYAVGSSSVLAHELGHAMSLIHTFGDGANAGNSCVTETDCTQDGDKVCDTEPSKIFTGCATGINPCTNATYAGVQYNIMNYGGCLDRFTQGQSDRALAGLLTGRNSLIYSQGVTAPGALPIVKPMSPTPPISNPVNNAWNSGPTDVVMNNLHYSSSGYGQDGNIDYKENFCAAPVGKIPATGTTLYVTTWANRQFAKVWIDFNNSGSFENNELVYSGRAPELPSGEFDYIHVAAITPAMLVGAATNTPLRMRIRADRNAITDATSQLAYGQTEDFAVTIDKALPVVFSNLDAVISNNLLKVSWVTETERNNDHFEIEGSVDGVHFTKIGEMKTLADGGMSGIPISYSFEVNVANANVLFGILLVSCFLFPSLIRSRKAIRIVALSALCAVFFIAACKKNNDTHDFAVSGKWQLRIAQVDKDGTKSYSKTITVWKK